MNFEHTEEFTRIINEDPLPGFIYTADMFDPKEDVHPEVMAGTLNSLELRLLMANQLKYQQEKSK